MLFTAVAYNVISLEYIIMYATNNTNICRFSACVSSRDSIGKNKVHTADHSFFLEASAASWCVEMARSLADKPSSPRQRRGRKKNEHMFQSFDKFEWATQEKQSAARAEGVATFMKSLDGAWSACEPWLRRQESLYSHPEVKGTFRDEECIKAMLISEEKVSEDLTY